LGEDSDKKDASRGVGRKAGLAEQDKDKLVKLTHAMVKKANVRYLVTLQMIQARFPPKVCLRVLRNALHERNIWFHKLRRKPILTDEDVACRWKWAKQYRKMTKSWWRQHIQMHIDNHAFKVPTNGDARNMLAAKRVHGTYRTPGDSLKKEHVKANDKLRMNTGSRSALIAGGVGAMKVLLWHVAEKQWCANEAAAMYSGPLSSALQGQYPSKRSYNVLEDNDPSGYQAKKARAMKAEKKIIQFKIPNRSPDLNVLDYSIWAEVEKIMRETERTWRSDRKETRQHFIRRLQETARSSSSIVIDKAIGDLARRTELLYRAKGGLFSESQEID
jgi:hypothetical protein